MMSSPSSFPQIGFLVFWVANLLWKCLSLHPSSIKKHTKTSRVTPVTPNDLLIPFVNLSSPSFHTKLQWVKALLSHQSPCEPFSSWWFQPIWKICSSNRIIAPNFESLKTTTYCHVYLPTQTMHSLSMVSLLSIGFLHGFGAPEAGTSLAILSASSETCLVMSGGTP